LKRALQERALSAALRTRCCSERGSSTRALVIVPIPVVLVVEELEVEQAEMVEATGVAFF
jgi:hypothetical protein